MSEERVQPRRNFIFVPGIRPDRFAKALSLQPDMVTVDLEDALLPRDKDRGRELSLPLFAERADDGIERVVRINSPRCKDGLKDILAIVELEAPPDGVMLPKVATPDEVRIVDELFANAARRINLHIIIESNAGLDAAQEIAAASPNNRSLLFGAIDMSAELGCALDFTSMHYPRSRVVHAAARSGLDAIDVPFLDLEDTAGLRNECELVQALGFTGKAAIHPTQLPVINEIFTPSADEIANARKIIDAFENAPDGLPVVDGKLVEEPVVKRMQRIMSIAAAAGVL